VHVHCDEGLVLGPLHLLQVLGRLADQGVEEVEELVVRLLHDFPVRSGGQSYKKNFFTSSLMPECPWQDFYAWHNTCGQA
jgi:hypothetical protein